MINFLKEAVSFTKTLTSKDIEKIASKAINKVESEVLSPPKIENEENKILERKRYFFSTCYRSIEEIEKQEIESILTSLNLITCDKHITQSEEKEIESHRNTLGENGFYLAINKDVGCIAVSGKFMAANLNFAN